MREVPEASPPPPNRRPLGVQPARARVRHGGGPVFPPRFTAPPPQTTAPPGRRRPDPAGRGARRRGRPVTRTVAPGRLGHGFDT